MYTYTLSYPEDYLELEKAGTIFYVGKGTGNRIHQHEREARRGGKGYKCNVIRKIEALGGKVVKKILAHFSTHKEATWYEIALIFFLPNLTNLTLGGDGLVGYVMTTEHKTNIGKSIKVYTRTEEEKKHLAVLRTGKTTSAETRIRQGIAHQELTHTEEAKRKIQVANTGRKMPKEAIERRILIMEGKPRIINHSGRTYSGLIAPNGQQYDNITNLTAFCREHGLQQPQLNLVANGKRKSYKGWHLRQEGA